MAGIQILQRVSYIATGWPAYRGARDLQHMSACDLEASERASIHSQIWMAAGSVLQILAGMVVLISHWYRSSFQGEDVCGAHLPWEGWSWHRSEGCCSILGLELGAGLTLPNCFFYCFVYTWPEDTSMYEQLGFCGSLMELVSCCSTLSHSDGGMMRASPCRKRPSSMVRVSQCCQYGCNG